MVWARRGDVYVVFFMERYGDSVALERDEAYLVLVKGA